MFDLSKYSNADLIEKYELHTMSQDYYQGLGDFTIAATHCVFASIVREELAKRTTASISHIQETFYRDLRDEIAKRMEKEDDGREE